MRPPEQAGSGHRLSLRILATTDLHMHLLPYDYFIDAPSDIRGLTRTASLIAAARAEADNCLLLDNGDFLTGTPMADEIARRISAPNTADSELHPMIAVMNRLGYDAATLGNHDFDHGIAFLQKTLAGAEFPLYTPAPLPDPRTPAARWQGAASRPENRRDRCAAAPLAPPASRLAPAASGLGHPPDRPPFGV